MIPLDMQTYELMYILNTTASEKDEADKVLALISTFSGTVVTQSSMGKRKFAYQVGKHLEGVYNIVTFSMEQSKFVEFKKKLALNENIIRNLITVVKSPTSRKQTKSKEKKTK